MFEIIQKLVPAPPICLYSRFAPLNHGLHVFYFLIKTHYNMGYLQARSM